MAKLVRPNKLYLAGLYFRCLGMFAFQIQNFTFAEFKSSHKTSKGSRTRSSQESFSSVRIHQAENCSLSQQEGELSLCPSQGGSDTSPSTEVFLEQQGWNGMEWNTQSSCLKFSFLTGSKLKYLIFFKSSFFLLRIVMKCWLWSLWIHCWGWNGRSLHGTCFSCPAVFISCTM